MQEVSANSSLLKQEMKCYQALCVVNSMIKPRTCVELQDNWKEKNE